MYCHANCPRDSIDTSVCIHTSIGRLPACECIQVLSSTLSPLTFLLVSVAVDPEVLKAVFRFSLILRGPFSFAYCCSSIRTSPVSL